MPNASEQVTGFIQFAAHTGRGGIYIIRLEGGTVSTLSDAQYRSIASSHTVPAFANVADASAGSLPSSSSRSTVFAYALRPRRGDSPSRVTLMALREQNGTALGTATGPRRGHLISRHNVLWPLDRVPYPNMERHLRISHLEGRLASTLPVACGHDRVSQGS